MAAPRDAPRLPRDHYEYRAALLSFSKTLVHMIALALDLDELYLDKYLRFPHTACRLLRYPPQEVSNDVGIGAHADYSWFTLVNQLSPDPALEVLNANGHWVSAVPIHDGHDGGDVPDVLWAREAEEV